MRQFIDEPNTFPFFDPTEVYKIIYLRHISVPRFALIAGVHCSNQVYLKYRLVNAGKFHFE